MFAHVYGLLLPVAQQQASLGAFTVTAAAGTYTLTGQAANLLAGYRLDAQAGSYSLTGQAANLLVGYRLDAVAGSYTLSGQAVTLTYSGKFVTADAGTYTLSGQAVSLLVGYRVDAAAGSYTLSGQSASLQYAGIDNFDDGSTSDWTQRFVTTNTTYSESGGQQHFVNVTTQGRHAASINAVGSIDDIEVVGTVQTSAQVSATTNGGVFVRGSGAAASENGYAAVLFDNTANGTKIRISKYVAGTVFTLGDFAFTWVTGQSYFIRFRVINNGGNVDLKVKAWAFNTSAEPGAWLAEITDDGTTGGSPITGAGWAGLFAFAVANLDFGRFAWATNGGTANPFNQYVVTAAAGSYTLSGQAANLLLGARLDAQAGSYTLSGQDVTLSAGARAIAADAGAYTLTGQSVSLLTGYRLDAQAGSYSLSGQAANLLVGYRLDAQAGSYTLTGQSVATLVGYRLDAVAGSYTLSGQAVTLTYVPLGGGAFTIAADAGSYALTGSTAINLIYLPKLIRPIMGTYYTSAIVQNVTRFRTLLGYDIALAMDFCAYDTKANLQATVTSISTFWKNYNVSNGKNHRLYLSLPTGTNDGQVTDNLIGNGTTLDAYYTAFAQKLVDDGHEDALIRIGWEMNGGWFPFATSTTNFKLAFRKIVNLFRTIVGQAFEFVWSPALGFLQNPPGQYYPLDASNNDTLVDWIAPDAYGQVYDSRNKTPSELWDRDTWGYDADHAGGSPTTGANGYQQYHLQWFAREAQTRGKKFGIAECGCGWSPDRHGFGDANWWWENVATTLTQWGPASGALLGVFDIDPQPVPDYYSAFTGAENYNVDILGGTGPSNWYQQKDRSVWAFRRYFGDLAQVTDLSQRNFETNAPSGMTIDIESDYLSGSTLTIPFGSAPDVIVGRVNAAVGERLWAHDAGEADGTSTTFPAAVGNQIVYISLGLFDGSFGQVGGRLQLRSGRLSTLMSGKNLRLGVRNALGGLNQDIAVQVVNITAAGASTGILNFGAANSNRPNGITPRWNGNVSWVDSAVAVGFCRAGCFTAASRRAAAVVGVGAVTDIDHATSYRCTHIPSGTAGSQTMGGLVARASGAVTAETGYTLHLGQTAGNVQSLVMRRYNAGAFTDLVTVPFAFSANTLYRLRMQVSGTGATVTLRGKVWLDGTAEPGAWTIDTTDVSASRLTAAGWAGLFAFFWNGSSTTQHDFDFYGWDTVGGSPVPSGTSIVAQVGSYTLSGQVVTLTHSTVNVYTIAADAGSYALLGADVELTYIALTLYTIIAEAGSYTLTGNEVLTRYSGERRGGGAAPSKAKQRLEAVREQRRKRRLKQPPRRPYEPDEVEIIDDEDVEILPPLVDLPPSDPSDFLATLFGNASVRLTSAQAENTIVSLTKALQAEPYYDDIEAMERLAAEKIAKRNAAQEARRLRRQKDIQAVLRFML